MKRLPAQVALAHTTFFDMRTGVILHELEHARQYQDEAGGMNRCNRNGHLDKRVSFCGETATTRSFDDCFKQVGLLVSNHQIHTTSFVQALVTRWQRELSSIGAQPD